MFAQYRCVATTMRIVSGLVVATAVGGRLCADEAELTFFGWSDQHVAVNGDGQHLLPAIDAMNSLPGTEYPAEIGGRVATPAFVIGCGDITEWPTNAAKNTYHELVTRRLKFPSYDLAGNHDEGGKSPSDTITNWIRSRHGDLSYAFGCQGVHVVVLFSKYDESLNSPAQPVSQEAIGFLRDDLAKLDKATPVVVALHLCFDAITNRDELVRAFGDANVLLVLGGHYHKAKVDRYRDINFVQLPSPAPNSSQEVTVIRITADRVLAIPYQYEKKTWSEDRGKILHVPIRGPAAQNSK
ncbi:MAG: hypothetical protein FJ276_30810 [Planctomycetes bacterium]|nr:hypothetical protein [Planctomycetota bacterium]